MNVLQNTIHFIPLHQTMAAEDISGDRAQRKIPWPLYYTAPFLSSSDFLKIKGFPKAPLPTCTSGSYTFLSAMPSLPHPGE